MENRTLLEIKNLVTEFRSDGEVTKAVNNVSFTLNKGETIGIVGESGSGKSVTSLSAMRLIPNPPGEITGGEILFHGKDGVIDLVKATEKQMRSLRGNEIAMIFQEPMTSLNPVYTCGDQVAEAIMLHQKVSKKEAKKITIELFKKVELPRPDVMFDTYPHQISGGQKQRVMIAMAMSCNPSILIADEPTTALDVTVQKTILELMMQLQQEQDMGIMFITHDLGVIAELADKVVVMYKGKIVEQGTVMDIFTNPQHPYTKGLLACRPPLNRRLHWLPTVADFMSVDENGEMKEKNKSVEEVTENLVISPEETAKKHEKIYAQEPILEIKNLKTYFPISKGVFGRAKEYVKAVNDVSFKVYPGETLGLVGESGCGKTTLGRTILKLVEPTEGKIIFEGKDITHLSVKEMREYRKEMQIIFQDPYSSLNPRITIGEAIMEPMRVHNVFSGDAERKERVMELLKRVDLPEQHFYRYPHEFSGGQRQRICIARSLALNPKFIICDESVSALDVSVQAQVLNLLNELKEEFKFTYIFISHDLSVVKFMSDKMIVMQEGVIKEMGYADEIYNNPKTDYTKSLINAIPKGEIDDIKKSLDKKVARRSTTA
ncbi:MAG: ABC transporter ATP-binding protein [Flavobacteriales bacterium]|nr:ABC transporter ATP-binding protein [Flavobacteriales bacterium]MCW8913758.1 ABC transporter ATP-binding protein [Flavobacteriales bacterium]MCW8938460.1 ABC transporter ATP-binding protein [Flavobacteriales bacterium]MCW8941138.1 ABC transporter ATP-binding protein [Flavobacteriales bacterium]MCW8969225.1 ABC transporter ATP-binding protein [Flavobacteriales bacterium]